MNLKTYIESHKKAILQSIDRQCDDLMTYDIANTSIMKERLYEYTSRGKLLRGVFVCLSTESFQDTNYTINQELMYKVAGAIELAQSALLIHDDIMDNDDFRRNKPSIHKLFENDINKSNAKKTGESLAICVGDIAIFHLFSYLAEYPELVQLFSRELSKTALGQALEIMNSIENQEISKEDILNIIKNKTANYTFLLPFMAGGLLAKSLDQEHLVFLKRFCLLAGYIFQIKDDELNLLSVQLDKSIGGDIRENKKTLCRYELLKRIPEAKELFISDLSLEKVRDLYISSGAKEEIVQQLLIYKTEASDLIGKLPIKEQYQSLWIELLDYLLERNY